MQRLFPLVVALFLGTMAAHANALDDVGYTDLITQLQGSGTSVPNGTGVSVTQVEAAVTGTNVPYGYMPTPSQFAGATITNLSQGTYSATTSWHANMVGNAIYGNSAMASEIATINVYYVNDWLQTGYLRFGYSGSAPAFETSDVANHSWVGSFIPSYGLTTGTLYDQSILNRLDYSIERDDYVAVVGVNNNDSGTAQPQNLLASAYNVLSVGVTDGTHVTGTSTTVNTSVTFPHIVAPATTTSEATGIVSSGAALMIQTGSSMGSANAMKSETIKAVLLAGATKDEFEDWNRSDTSPLDETFGAGELNVQNSYNIMAATEQAPSASPAALVATTGWDYHSVSFNQTVSYYFNLSGSGDISVALTWNALYAGGDFNNLSLTLANLNLFLYRVEPGDFLSLVQQSIATGSNLEYIWVENLMAGDYVIQVHAANGNASYAVAWQAIPEPETNILLIIGAIALAVAAKRARTSARSRSAGA